MADIVKKTLNEASKYMQTISILETDARNGEFTKLFIADPRVTRVVAYNSERVSIQSPKLEKREGKYAGEDFDGVIFIDPNSEWEAKVYAALSQLAPLTVILTAEGPQFLAEEPADEAEQLETLPPTQTVPERFNTGDKWKDAVLNKVREILIMTGADQEPDWFAEMMSEKHWPTWFKVFTSEYVDPDNNFELLELVGDRTLEIAFVRIVLERAEAQGVKMSPKTITPLKSEYMSTEFQSRLADRLGLNDTVIRAYRITPAIKEDVFEALFGAIFEVGNDVQDGIGYLFAQNLLGELLSNVRINLTEVYEKPKTQVIQFFRDAGWIEENDNPYIRYKEPENIVTGFFTATLIPSRKGVEEGLPTPLGTGNGKTKEIAETKAYENALQRILAKGYTRQFFEERKKAIEFTRSIFDDVRDRLFSKLGRQGLSQPYFRIPRHAGQNENMFVQLIAKDSSGKSQILGEAEHPNLTVAKKLAVQNYLK
jgi:dsRNA-specific ribonuclease